MMFEGSIKKDVTAMQGACGPVEAMLFGQVGLVFALRVGDELPDEVGGRKGG